jgi:hypothetical protein
MAGVTIFQRAQRDFGTNLSARGHHVVYRTNESNRCPGCGRAQWYVGRITAECGFCGTAVALAEAKWAGASGSGGAAAIAEKLKLAADTRDAALAEEARWAERREHERIKSAGRTLQLLIDGSPRAFAIQNLSAGGVMGSDPVGLEPTRRCRSASKAGSSSPRRSSGPKDPSPASPSPHRCCWTFPAGTDGPKRTAVADLVRTRLTSGHPQFTRCARPRWSASVSRL